MNVEGITVERAREREGERDRTVQLEQLLIECARETELTISILYTFV